METPSSLNNSTSSLDGAGSEGSSRAGSPANLSRTNSTDTVLFLGDNVIVNNGSLLNRRNKQLRIKFDEDTTHTFEYPSEEAMLADPESPVPQVPVVPLRSTRTPTPDESADEDRSSASTTPPLPARAPVVAAAVQSTQDLDHELEEDRRNQTTIQLGKRPAETIGTTLIYQRKSKFRNLACGFFASSTSSESSCEYYDCVL